VILVFVGLKMVWLDGWYGGKFPIGLSLAIIAGVLAASIAVSMLGPTADGAPDATGRFRGGREAHAPVVRLQSRRAQAAGREESSFAYRAGLDPPTPED
jgi:hypothetical protein